MLSGASLGIAVLTFLHGWAGALSVSALVPSLLSISFWARLFGTVWASPASMISWVPSLLTSMLNTTTGSLWSKVKVAVFAILIGADLVGTAMLVWHERDVQYKADMAQINAARIALQTQISDDNQRIDEAESKALEARAEAEHALAALSNANGPKFTPEIVSRWNAIH